MEKILPVDKNEYFELRFHSIGGQGAYTTGQMVASLGSNTDGIKASVFASYGSEKKGAPVDVYVRFLESEENIKNFSAVKNPNVVCVFHEHLLNTIDVLKGVNENGILIVNTDLDAQELVDKYKLNINNIMTVDATKISVETKAMSNTVMFGSVLKAMTFFDKSKGSKQIEDKLSYKYPHLVERNIEAFERGFEESISYEVSPVEAEKTVHSNALGYNNQYTGGIIKGMNTNKVNRAISREGYLPAFNQEVCINCTKCDNTCPDDCFVWEEKEGRRGKMEMVLTGIDYQYCKGCLRCVEACPTDSLTTIIEQRGYALENTVSKYFKGE